MIFKIDPLYYSSPEYRKIEGEHYVNSNFIVSISIDKVGRIFTINEPTGFAISKERAVEIVQIMENQNDRA